MEVVKFNRDIPKYNIKENQIGVIENKYKIFADIDIGERIISTYLENIKIVNPYSFGIPLLQPNVKGLWFCKLNRTYPWSIVFVEQFLDILITKPYCIHNYLKNSYKHIFRRWTTTEKFTEWLLWKEF